MILAEMKEIKKKVGKPLPRHYKEIVIKSFMYALRKPLRKNKAPQESNKEE